MVQSPRFDIDSNASNNYTLTYDADGQLTDDGQSYKYVYDAFGRIRQVKNQSNTVIADYTSNALGYRLGIRLDTDNDGDSDGSDTTFYAVWDERWRQVATFRSTDSSPKEQFINHQAGLDGSGGAFYIDTVITREKDANTAWTSASDGTLEERRYYCQYGRANVCRFWELTAVRRSRCESTMNDSAARQFSECSFVNIQLIARLANSEPFHLACAIQPVRERPPLGILCPNLHYV